MRFRARALVVVVALTAGVAAFPSSASAFSGTPDVPVPPVKPDISWLDKMKYPAAILVDLAGEVAPATRAYETLSYSIDNWQTEGGIVGDVLEGTSIAQHIPGFTLGMKIGSWIDSALGIDPGIAPGVEPNGDIDQTGLGWVGPLPPGDWSGVVHSCPFSHCGTATETGWGVNFDPAVWQYQESAPADHRTGLTVHGNVVNTYDDGADASQLHLGEFRFSAAIHCVTGTTLYGINVTTTNLATGGFNLTGDDLTHNEVTGGCENQGGLAYVQVDSVGIFGTWTPSQADFTNTPERWYPVGSPQRTDAGPDPQRRWRMTSHCKSGHLSVVESEAFKETDESFAGWPAPYECETLDGSALTAWELDEITLDANGNDTDQVKHVESWILPPAINDLDQRVETRGGTQPADGICTGATQAADPCIVTLWKHYAGGQTKDCFTIDEACDGWWTAPDRDSATTGYDCTYGPESAAWGSPELAVLDIDQCQMYIPTFNRQKRSTGVGVSDPGTCDSCGRGTSPPATEPVENPPSTTPDPHPTPTPSTNCWPSGWSSIFNPLSWVLTPIKCALVWAFEPTPSVVTSTLGDTWADIQARPPFSIVLPIAHSVGDFVGTLGGGCSGTLANFGDSIAVPCQPPAGINPYVLVFKGFLMCAIAGFVIFDLWRFTEKMTGHA